MKKLIFSLSILALLVVQIPLAAAALAPARGTCAVDLTGATNIFHSVWSGAGSHAFDIRYGGFLSATGGSNTVGIHNGGELDTYGGSNVV